MMETMSVMGPTVRNVRTPHENNRNSASADAAQRCNIDLEQNGSNLCREGCSVTLFKLLKIRPYTSRERSPAGAQNLEAVKYVPRPDTIKIFKKFIMDRTTCTMDRPMHSHIHITFMKSGWVQRRYVPTL